MKLMNDNHVKLDELMRSEHKAQGLAQRSGDDYWPSIDKKPSEWQGNMIPNPWAWTDKHAENSNETAYAADGPAGVPPPGYPLPGFAQYRFAQQGAARERDDYWPKIEKG